MRGAEDVLLGTCSSFERDAILPTLPPPKFTLTQQRGQTPNKH